MVIPSAKRPFEASKPSANTDRRASKNMPAGLVAKYLQGELGALMKPRCEGNFAMRLFRKFKVKND
jgi:hypothetical protein